MSDTTATKTATVATESSRSRPLTKNEKRRLKKKNSSVEEGKKIEEKQSKGEKTIEDDVTDVEIQYVTPDLTADLPPEALEQFASVVSRFSAPLIESTETSTTEGHTDEEAEVNKSEHVDTKTTSAPVLSKKARKLARRLTVAELKQKAPQPEVVEAHDVSSPDPVLLVYLKAVPHTVPVPRHWSHIRKYLQGKRATDKTPYQLPAFIAETGIAAIRAAVMEAEDARKAKAKARDRVRPKMGRVDVDYQVLHDAFFRHQTKPKLTHHGELYYEGKENEFQGRGLVPGALSAELRDALGMESPLTPPPWLANMQRYGPPPSYPSLRIPGLNAPLPPGASYGMPFGTKWGMPPVDETGRAIYGDPFGSMTAAAEAAAAAHGMSTASIDRSFLWGSFINDDELEEISSDEESIDEEAEAEAAAADAAADLAAVKAMDEEAALLDEAANAGTTMDLRKRAVAQTEGPTPELYQVLGERKSSAIAGGQIFGSDRTYVMNDSAAGTATVSGGLSTVSGLESEISGRKRKAEPSSVTRKVKEFKF